MGGQHIRALSTAALVALGAVFAPAAAADTSPYTSAPYEVTTNAYAFGQAPVFMPDGRVVFGKDFETGDGAQIYIANRDGSALRCPTCGQPGPNNVPAVRPQGDWILFHSWRGHHITLGSPGYGGLGSALYAMRPDGSHVTALTGTDPARGAGEGEDDYHAYWSPDGRRIVYTHLNWNFVTDNGQGKWDVRVADFIDDGHNRPRLANERVVRPANGHWYETQWWALDGSGFLYTETWGTAMDTELFFCRLTAAGCQSTQLTNTPSWNEQAIFTPDGKDVIFMSSRDAPGFFNTFAQFAQDANLTADEDYLLTLPVFYGAFLQPVAEETTDLYQLDLANGSVRRLTSDGGDGWIVPEFSWDPSNEHLWFTENRLPPGARVGLPLDLVKELQEAADFLEHPPAPDSGNLGSANALPVEQRTRVLHFDLQAPARSQPLACSRRGKLRLALPRLRGVVDLRVRVGRRTVLARRGHAPRGVAIRWPAARRFRVVTVEKLRGGGTVTTTRSYADCRPTGRARTRRDG